MKSPTSPNGQLTIVGVVSLVVLCLSLGAKAVEADLTRWTPIPAEFTGGKLEAGDLMLSSGQFGSPELEPWQWAGWSAPATTRDVELNAIVTITRPAVDLH